MEQPNWTTALDALLAAAAEPATRDHWTRYLKGAAQFRGVPMAGVRRAVRSLWRDGLNDLGLDPQLGIAGQWFEQPWSEDKLAAVLLIAEHLAPDLRAEDCQWLAGPFASGAISDWNVCDWMCVKAVNAYLTAGGAVDPGRARAVAAWGSAPSLWQRRAAVVSFVPVAAQGEANFDGFTDLVLEACAANLVVEDRFAHTGPGWLLRELSAAEPQRVQAFVQDHPELSREGRRMALARLAPGPYRRR